MKYQVAKYPFTFFVYKNCDEIKYEFYRFITDKNI